MTFNRFFQITVLALATLFGLGPQMARAQDGVSVQLVGQMPGPSNDCSGGFIPLVDGQLLIGAANNCQGQNGVWRVINSTTGCLALKVNDSWLTTTVIENGMVVTVGTHTNSGFRSCLPPGESAMFKGSPLGVSLTGQAFLTPKGVRSTNGLRSFEGAFPIITVSNSAFGANGALAFLPSPAGGSCGLPGDDLVFIRGTRDTLSIQNNQCDQ